MNKSFKSLIFAIFCTGILNAGDGTLDPSFGTGGIVITSLPNTPGGNALYISADGSMFITGFTIINNNQVIFVTKLRPDGNVDTSFGTGGIVQFPQLQPNSIDTATGIAVQTDNKIVIAGYSAVFTLAGAPANIVVIRLNADGSPDTSFGVNGIVLTPRLQMGGSDQFGDQANGVVLQEDRKIIVAGLTDSGSSFTHSLIVRYNQNGTLDTSFNGTGFIVIDFSQTDIHNDAANAVGIQSDGKIVMAGLAEVTTPSVPATPSAHFALARVNVNGTIDTSFNPTGGPFGNPPGTVVTDFFPNFQTIQRANAINIQPDGKIIAAGNAFTGVSKESIALARYNTNGSLDTTFNAAGGPLPFTNPPGTVMGFTSTNAFVNDAAFGLALQADGKIVTAGFTNFPFIPVSIIGFLLARYLPTGVLDASFNGGTVPPGFVNTIFSLDPNVETTAAALAIQGNGFLVAAGVINDVATNSTQVAAARYDPTVPLTQTLITSPTNGSFIASSGVVVSGTAQNPSFVDIYVDGNFSISTETIGTSNTWSVVLPNVFSPGTSHTIIAISRYHDDGHVNLTSAPINVFIPPPPPPLCPIIFTDPFVQLYNSFFPCPTG